MFFKQFVRHAAIAYRSTQDCTSGVYSLSTKSHSGSDCKALQRIHCAWGAKPFCIVYAFARNPFCQTCVAFFPHKGYIYSTHVGVGPVYCGGDSTCALAYLHTVHVLEGRTDWFCTLCPNTKGSY